MTVKWNVDGETVDIQGMTLDELKRILVVMSETSGGHWRDCITGEGTDFLREGGIENDMTATVISININTHKKGEEIHDGIIPFRHCFD